MAKEIIIKSDEFETMVGVTEDARLAEIFFEREQSHSILGNIYKGKVENVLPGMQAAFVNFGAAKNGFLYINDAVPREFDEEGNIVEPSCSIGKILKSNQEIMLQIIKEPAGTKGARITTHPTLPGRFVVLMPTVEYIGVSRRIESQSERERLREVAKNSLPQGMGLILRTVAEGVSDDAIIKDIKAMVKLWKRILQKSVKAPALSLIHKDLTLLERMVRDTFEGEIKTIHVDSFETREKLAPILESISPEYMEKIAIAKGDIMEVNDAQTQLNRALGDKVWLECGGYLIIQHMEALTVIDVNTGKYVGNASSSLNDTVLRTNIDAAVEIAHQLRLRNLGGIVIIDFIDMKEEEDRMKVVEVLGNELKQDRIKTNILGFTQLGLLEMTRKKNGHSLSDVLERDCVYCSGTGKVLSEEGIFAKVKTQMAQVVEYSQETGIYVEANPVVASYVIGPMGTRLASLEREFKKNILVKGNSDLKIPEFVVRNTNGDFKPEDFSPVKIGQVLNTMITEYHAENDTDAIVRINGYVIVVTGGADYVGKITNIEIVDAQKTYARAIIPQNI